MVVSAGEVVSCLDAGTGRELWNTAVNEPGGIPALTEKEVFLGSSAGILYRLDIRTGKIMKFYRLGGSGYSPVVANGCVLVITEDNRLYCLGQISYYRIMFSIAAILILLFLIKASRTTF